MNSSTPESPVNESPRETLIDTAVRFLTNPNIVDRPFQQKQSFLKSKGLTEEEIRLSCERANTYVTHSPHEQETVVPMYGLQHQFITPQPLSVWSRIRQILHTMALLGGLGYVIFWLYKSYIEPFLFGRPKPKRTAEESLLSIEEAICTVTRNTTELRAEIRSELNRISQDRESGSARNLADIKSDIATVKGLLLSRQQFPSAPSPSLLRSGQTNKPSIPAWQMTTEQKNSKDNESQSGEKDLQTDFENPLNSSSNPTDSAKRDEADQEASAGSLSAQNSSNVFNGSV